jgi:hypothetical protein
MDRSKMAHLLVDRVPVTKDDPAADQAGKKGVCAALLAFVETPLDEQGRLVEDDVFGEVERVLPG